MSDLSNKKNIMYLLFSFFAIVITISLFLVGKPVYDTSSQINEIASISDHVAQLSDAYDVELVKADILKNDLAVYSDIYNSTLEDYNNLISVSSSSDSQLISIKNDLSSAQLTNSNLKKELAYLEAQLK